jgi:hypothetical protein
MTDDETSAVGGKPLQLLVQYRLNLWNRDFFNGLERRDGSDTWRQTYLLPVFALRDHLCCAGDLRDDHAWPQNGSMLLGEVTQAAAAFAAVQGAFNWLVDNYPRLAEWASSAGRVGVLLFALDRLGPERPSNVHVLNAGARMGGSR